MFSRPVTKTIANLCLAFFFFLPFERIPTIEVAGFTVKISYLLGIALIILFLHNNPLPFFKKISASDYFLGCFWLLSGLSLFWTTDQKKGLVTFLMWTFVFVVYFFLSKVLTDKKLRQKAENIIIISTVLVCIFGIFQYLGDVFGLSTAITGLRLEYTKIVFGFPRIQSVGLEPLYFANFLFFPFYLVAKRYVQNYGMFNKFFGVLILILVNMFLALSRGAFLALGITAVLLVLVLVVKWYREKQNDYGKKLVGLILVAIAAMAISVGLVFLPSIGNKINTVNTFVGHAAVDDSKGGESVPGRLETYKAAFDMFKEKPLFGYGIGSASEIISQKTHFSAKNQTVNNEFLEILAENGLIGFLLFMAFLVSILIELRKVFVKTDSSGRFVLISMLLGLVAIFIQYNFFSTLYIIYIWAFLALLKGEIDGSTQN